MLAKQKILYAFYPDFADFMVATARILSPFQELATFLQIKWDIFSRTRYKVHKVIRV